MEIWFGIFTKYVRNESLAQRKTQPNKENIGDYGHNYTTPDCCVLGLTIRCVRCGYTLGIWKHPHRKVRHRP